MASKRHLLVSPTLHDTQQIVAKRNLQNAFKAVNC